jgi:ABC-type antimicrobial peptide transport system permease subunit
LLLSLLCAFVTLIYHCHCHSLSLSLLLSLLFVIACTVLGIGIPSGNAYQKDPVIILSPYGLLKAIA